MFAVSLLDFEHFKHQVGMLVPDTPLPFLVSKPLFIKRHANFFLPEHLKQAFLLQTCFFHPPGFKLCCHLLLHLNSLALRLSMLLTLHTLFFFSLLFQASFFNLP